MTAIDAQDALGLARRALAPLLAEPEFGSIRADLDIRTLDPRHILPNMGNCSVRGVWFPWG